MSWLLALALLPSTADRGASATAVPTVIEMAISPKVDRSGRWCFGPVFEARVSNPGSRPVWLDLGTPADEVDVSSHWLNYDVVNGKGLDQLSSNVHSDDWGSIEVLRGSEATLLRPGESVTRIAKLNDVRLRSGRVGVELSIRIHGTQDLKDSKVHTYEPRGTVKLDLRRRGRCFDVRRLTGR